MHKSFSQIGTFLIAFALATFAGVRETPSEDSKPTEYDVKAAYIYNFAKFVEWPPKRSQDIAVCIIGKDLFGHSLDSIEWKNVGDRKIRIKRNISLQNLRGCDILFIDNSENEQLARILETIDNLGILTVADTKGFAHRGVMINFYIENKTVRFEINPKAASRAGLKISSNLLKIARIVEGP